MDQITKNYMKIGLAGVFWGTLGLFGKILERYGLSSEMIAFSRLFSGFLILLIIFAIKDPGILKIDKKGLWSTCLIGVVSQGIFNLSYFGSIKLVGSFTAVVLLYFSPVIMFLLGTFMYKEKASKKKIFAVTVCLVGCIYGVTGGDFSTLQTNTLGIALGLVAALTYSLMPALSKKVTSKYNPFTIIIYSFMFGAILLIPFAKPITSIMAVQDKTVFLVLPVFGIVASSIPYCLYIPSLHNVQVSKLGVIASVELVVSIIIAVTFLKEPLNFGKIAGATIIMASIVIMNINIEIPRFKKRYKTIKK
ncbi:MAG: DMT family transporter [Proteocatella sp.]